MTPGIYKATDVTRAAGCLGILFFVLAAAPTVVGQDCLSYGPVLANLSGTLSRKTFPGPPNYESVQRGDRPETYWILVLDHPACVLQSSSDPELDVAERGVEKVQLVFSGHQDYERYRSLVGKRIAAEGTLFHSITGHHHTQSVERNETQHKVAA